MMRPIFLALLLGVFASPLVFAEPFRPYLDEPETPVPDSVEDRVPWKEGTTALPPWPTDSDLVEFQVDDPGSRFRQYIDAKHLSVGADGVVRFTLVVDSGSGARNVSFEGLRCTPTGLFKIYAYGYEGRFEESESEWIRIEGRTGDEIHRDLHRSFLCSPRKFEPRPKKEMIHAMKSRAPADVGSSLLPD